MFTPQQVQVFRFVSYTFDSQTGVATFTYAFDDDTTFVETLTFDRPQQPAPAWPPQDVVPFTNADAFDRCLFLLSLVAGVSYYKAAAPKRAVIESGAVTHAELEFLQATYFNGLGEFAYVNQIDMADRPVFEADIIETRAIEDVEVERKSLVPVGGGKDSCVTIELMREMGEVTLASVNRARPILDVMKAAGLPSLHVDRALSPELFRINKEGALNGHVPITAMVSLTMVAAALLNGFDSVVMSNERSASSGNLEWQGRPVNHQWSKSLEAEIALSNLVKTSIAPNVELFSLLRPLSELSIAKRFAQLDRYHDVFTSCNRAFRIEESRRVDRWCLDCPKCRFVFLALAPFINDVRLAGIFGGDMLRDKEQAGGYDELIGWNAHKPFECVGEVEESVAAFQLLIQSIAWRDHELVRRFETDILPNVVVPRDVIDHVLKPTPVHNIPGGFYAPH